MMDNYPAGAEHDPNAPYNQSDPPEVEVELTMTETLTKSVPHWTNKVWRVYDEEGYGSWESDGFDPEIRKHIEDVIITLATD